MNTTATGRQAETAACEYLVRQGFTILERNWRTRRAEIDVIATKGDCLYCVEVKYRHTDSQGSGLEYITSGKIRRMRLAAEAYVAAHRWPGMMTISGLEVAAPDNTVTAFIESIDTDS